MKRLILLVLLIACIATPAYARTKRVKRVSKPVARAAYVDFDYSKVTPYAKVEQRHIDAAKAICAELEKTATEGVTLFGVDFWAQGLADQEAAR